MRNLSEMGTDVTVGIDLGDKINVIVGLDAAGEVSLRDRVPCRREDMKMFFEEMPRCVVAMETGTHSRWVSFLLSEMGFEVLVGNPRRIRSISESDHKDDDHDAEQLARIARFDRKLLYPIRHRNQEAHRDLEELRARDILVACRTKLVNHVRGVVKAFGHRIPPGGSAAAFHKRAAANMPEELVSVISPLLEMLEELTRKIREYDRRMEQLCKEKYPETAILRAITGVGPQVSLGFVLTLEDPERYKSSRTVGAFLGLTPRRHQSGEIDKQMRITKAGSGFMRRLLVNSANYILGAFGPDCDLRRFGQRIESRGGKSPKRRARVAVARKLAVLMHSMWLNGTEYQPLGYGKKVS
jgi:transposase